MPAGGAWGTFNPYTHQQSKQFSSANPWGGGQRQSQQQGRYQQPPMPYSGAGAWGQPQGGGYPYQSQQPSRRGGGGGMGGFGGGRGGGFGGRSSYMPPSRDDMNYQMMMESGMGQGSASYVQSLPEYKRRALLSRAGWGGNLPTFMLSQQPGWGGLQKGAGYDIGSFGQGGGTGGGWIEPQQSNPWMMGSMGAGGQRW